MKFLPLCSCSPLAVFGSPERGGRKPRRVRLGGALFMRAEPLESRLMLSANQDGGDTLRLTPPADVLIPEYGEVRPITAAPLSPASSESPLAYVSAWLSYPPGTYYSGDSVDFRLVNSTTTEPLWTTWAETGGEDWSYLGLDSVRVTFSSPGLKGIQVWGQTLYTNVPVNGAYPALASINISSRPTSVQADVRYSDGTYHVGDVVDFRVRNLSNSDALTITSVEVEGGYTVASSDPQTIRVVFTDNGYKTVRVRARSAVTGIDCNNGNQFSTTIYVSERPETNIDQLPTTGFAPGALTNFVFQQAEQLLRNVQKEAASIVKILPGIGLEDVSGDSGAALKDLASLRKKVAGAYGRKGRARLGAVTITRGDLELADRLLVWAWSQAEANIAQGDSGQSLTVQNSGSLQSIQQQVLSAFSPASTYGEASRVLGDAAAVTAPAAPASGLLGWASTVASTIGKMAELGVASITKGSPELSNRGRELARDPVLSELLNQTVSDSLAAVQDAVVNRLWDRLKRIPDRLEQALDNVSRNASDFYRRVGRSRLGGVYRGTVNWLINNNFVPQKMEINIKKPKGNGLVTGTIKTKVAVVDPYSGSIKGWRPQTGRLQGDIDADGNFSGSLSMGGSGGESFSWERGVGNELSGELRESYGTSIWLRKM